ncbi:Thioredoxin family protein [Histomonas meleagridis]|uniref:Thioredoxin family protein n=1 Tax=Histomonas meleagridis TaxID=135588 RepID=UPI00355A734B|nr:Thioredoxin family protein [Histomonas meleagridis]KAH0806208.1 Thioredoxin family protein [Histomonas meleagridis]
MFLLFLIGIKITADSKQAKEIIKNSSKVPAFLLLHSPYCGFCKQIRPTWQDLMNKYENETGVVIGEVDCIENKICHEICNITGYPSFCTYLRGKSTNLRPARNMENFINITENLLKADLSLPCSAQYPYEFKQKYPSFIFSSNSPPRQQCKFINDVSKRFKGMNDQFYFSVSEKRTLKALISANTVVEYFGDFSTTSTNDFISEYRITSLGDWELTEAVSTRRKFMILIYNKYSTLNSFRPIFETHESSILCAKMPYNAFHNIYPDMIINTPTLAIGDKDTKTFHIINEVNDEESLKKILENVENGIYDKATNVNLTALYQHAQQKVNERKGKKRDKIVLLLLVALAVLIVAAILLTYILRSTTQKIE